MTDLKKGWCLGSTELFLGGKILVGWLSGFRAQNDSVANSRNANFVRRLGETAAPWEGGVLTVPRLCIIYIGICLTIVENHGNPQSG
jgi:hypothetical protein